MSNIEQFVAALSLDNMVDAKEAFESAIAAKINDKFEARKIELAAGITESSVINEADGWIAIHPKTSKKLEIKAGKDANSLYAAKQFAIKHWNLSKKDQNLMAIAPAYNESVNEAKMDDSEVLKAAKALAKNGKDEKAKSFGQGLVDYYKENDSFTPNQVSGLQNIMKNASFQMAEK
jgi:hypothetical protein